MDEGGIVHKNEYANIIPRIRLLYDVTLLLMLNFRFYRSCICCLLLICAVLVTLLVQYGAVMDDRVIMPDEEEAADA